MNGAVHVSDVRAKTAPRSVAPMGDRGLVSLVDIAARVSHEDGIGSSNNPNRFAAKKTKIAARARFTFGSAANRFTPAAPKTIAINNPRAVKLKMIPAANHPARERAGWSLEPRPK